MSFWTRVIVLPPGEWDPKIRIEPPKKVPTADKRKSVYNLNELGSPTGRRGEGGGSQRTRRCPPTRAGGGAGFHRARKLPWLPSAIYEGFHSSPSSAVLFIYLGCITNAITFGGLLGDATDNYQ
ncbi:hypothetical protein KUCAC02_029031 [Chaenocephalus aceratus]|uniref:Uncharacterized protein n=1 Tax=Chaenocephalus aceratus TaxID=36190 RepID=A0ACB9X4C6_CHAAC|nr:hypothetical protein KUCAC02_029031 [Chaenocephalus aceratus]